MEVARAEEVIFDFMGGVCIVQQNSTMKSEERTKEVMEEARAVNSPH